MMTDKELIQKYPFLEIKDKRACPGMTGTWLSDLPEGWEEKLLEMCDEIMGIAHNYIDKLIVIQTKEKFGGLRFYYYWNEEVPQIVVDMVEEIVDKYEELTYTACVGCGKETHIYTKGWILPMCVECAEVNNISVFSDMRYKGEKDG